MHRFYSDEKIELNSILPLSKEESIHAIKVLRLNKDEYIEILDGNNIYSAKIVEIAKNTVFVQTLAKKDSVEPKTEITLFQGLPKGDKLFTIIQKCTEIGVKSIVPLLMKRSVKKPSNEQKLIEKCNRTAIEACKQCGRNYIPRISKIYELSEVLDDLKDYDMVIVPWEDEKEKNLKTIVENIKLGYKIAIFIGPEGGIDISEVDKLRAKNAVTVTLGRRILRTETAGECTSFAILSMLNDI